jgi:hypothetical protein
MNKELQKVMAKCAAAIAQGAGLKAVAIVFIKDNDIGACFGSEKMDRKEMAKTCERVGTHLVKMSTGFTNNTLSVVDLTGEDFEEKEFEPEEKFPWERESSEAEDDGEQFFPN